MADTAQIATLAHRLGTTEHLSFLLRKARRLGLRDATDLMALATARGCHHYRTGETMVRNPVVSHAEFDDEELAVTLLSPCLPYDPRLLRIGAQMLARHGNRPTRLAFLARSERAQMVVRYVAHAGQLTEPQERFWSELLANLPSGGPEPPPGVMPHPSRFRLEAGLTNPKNGRTRGGPLRVWLRPAA